MQRLRNISAVACFLISIHFHCTQLIAADEAAIKQSIARGISYLKNIGTRAQTSKVGLATYAMLKGGVSGEDSVIKGMVNKIVAKCSSGQYRPAEHGIYEAACDAMALEALDSEQYRSQLEMMATYILKYQKANGGWYYPGRESNNSNAADTSITQYALLGLWAAKRAGVAIPPSAWDRAAQWHINTQDSSGGHFYHPFVSATSPKPTMTAAACGSLGVIEQNLFPKNSSGVQLNPKNRSDKKFGVLETKKIDDLYAQQERSTLTEPIRTNPQQINSAAKRAANWLEKEFQKPAYRGSLFYNEGTWVYYLAYTFERMGALQNLKTIGGHDWYATGSKFLLSRQEPGGSWNGRTSDVVDTSFCILFLSRATEKLLKRRIGPSVGNGLLAGGRGLPNDLTAVQEVNGKIKTKESLGELDELLAELERFDAESVESTQAAVVSKFTIADPETLVGQRDQLLTLVKHTNPETRRTAIWALSRCALLEDYSIFVNALSDPEIDVAVEARAALCWVSRKPLGFDEPESPADLLPKNIEASNATPAQWKAALVKWRTQVIPSWKAWHQRIRPYEERDQLDDPRFDN